MHSTDFGLRDKNKRLKKEVNSIFMIYLQIILLRKIVLFTNFCTFASLLCKQLLMTFVGKEQEEKLTFYLEC